MQMPFLIALFLAISIDASGASTRILRKGLLFGFLPIVGLLVWSFITPIHGAIIANGIIKIDMNSKTVQHLEGGIVKEILVKEGSRVEKNQPLLKLENIEVRSRLNILNHNYIAAQIKEARFLAQQKNQNEVIFPNDLLQQQDPKVKQLLLNERQLFHSKRKALNDKIHLLNVQIEQTNVRIGSLQNEASAITSGMGYIRKELDANLSLSSKGFTGKNQVWESERNLSEKTEQFNAQQANIEASRVNITSLKSQINALENEYKQEGDDQLKETRKELLEIKESLRPLVEQDNRSIVVSPVAGQIINLQVNTIGGIVAPGQPLMEVVPALERPLVEVKVNTLDIDNVYVNQEAKVQLLPYSRLKTPLLPSKLIYVSGDVIENKAKPGEYYYLAHLQIEPDALKNLPEKVKLYPGMPISAFMYTRQRTLWVYLIEPIFENMLRHDSNRKG